MVAIWIVKLMLLRIRVWRGNHQDESVSSRKSESGCMHALVRVVPLFYAVAFGTGVNYVRLMRSRGQLFL